MVYGKCSVGHAHLHAAAYSQFVGVDLGLEPIAGAGLQDTGGVVWGEEACVAEHVHEIGVFRSLRHQVDHFLHISFLGVAAADGVGSEEGGTHDCRYAFTDALYDAQHLELSFRAEAVAAFDFQACRAGGHHFFHALH